MINQYKTVQEQYKTAVNLNTRISIHEKYSTNTLGFGVTDNTNERLKNNYEI